MSNPTSDGEEGEEDGDTVCQTKQKSSKPSTTDENPEESAIGHSYWKREGK
jgi:hypothetical protein